MVLVVGAGIAFLALTVGRNWAEIAAYDWQARWAQLALSVVVLAGSFAFATYVWKRVLDRFAGSATSYPSLLRISFLSRIARYIPGKVWQFVAVGQLSAGSGSPARVIVSSLVVHTGFILLSGVVTGAVILAEHIPGVPSGGVLAIAGASILALIASHPRVINLGLALLSKVTRRPTFTWTGRWHDSLELMLLSLVNWLLQGVAFYLFADSIVELGVSDILPLTGMNAFAFVAGYVAFVAPAGAGVREATMASLLRGILPSGAAAVVAIASRLWMIMAELLAVALVLVLVPAPASGPPPANGQEHGIGEQGSGPDHVDP